MFRWLQKLQQRLRPLRDMNIPIYAANAAFFILLSGFPALILLLSLLRYTSLTVHSLISLLEGMFPEALLPYAERLLMSLYHNSSKTLISLSAVTTLWSASRGLYGVMKGLNAIYAVEESRGYVYARLISVVYTFAFFLVVLLTLVLHVFGTKLLAVLEKQAVLAFLAEVVDLRFFLLVFLQAGVFTALFMALPNRKNKLSDSLPGGLFAAIGWLVFSQLYSLYIDYFPGAGNVYGSVYAIALSMLWLYFCICILFYGGALNAFLMEKEKI